MTRTWLYKLEKYDHIQRDINLNAQFIKQMPNLLSNPWSYAGDHWHRYLSFLVTMKQEKQWIFIKTAKTNPNILSFINF